MDSKQKLLIRLNLNEGLNKYTNNFTLNRFHNSNIAKCTEQYFKQFIALHNTNTLYSEIVYIKEYNKNNPQNLICEREVVSLYT